MDTPFTPAQLQTLAKAAVRTGLNLAPGQEVIISAPLEAVPLVRKITEEAYKAGASLVTTFYADDKTALMRFRHAPESAFETASGWLFEGMGKAYKAGAARLAIVGGNPFLLSGEDPAKVSRANRARSIAAKPAMEPITAFATNWSIVAYPSQAWAAVMFPEDTPATALKKLADAIFATSRLNVADPAAEWATHNANLHKRRDWLNSKRFHALRFYGPGTDLTVGLADGHAWHGGSGTTKSGLTCNPNIPTEEVFTTPHCQRVNGYVRSTKPLSHQGTLIDGIQMHFKDGLITKATAEKGNDVLQNVLKTDPGAARIGEVALVPHSSPISQSGLLFYETLFDENAACHIALGQCYSECFIDGKNLTEEQVIAKGGNQSLIHIDWMIGSDEMDVDGLSADGTITPVFRKGEWA